MKRLSTPKGFTLIELLIVIVIISTLAVTVFVALNPAQRLKDARDAKRTSDVDNILSAIHQAIIDNKGTLPTNLPAVGVEAQLGTGVACTNTLGGCNTGDTCVNLMLGTINLSKYLKSMPIDPIGGTTYDPTKTGYSVVVDTNGLVTVRACAREGTVDIFSSR